MQRVRLEELVIKQFRNIEQAKLNPGARFNILTGSNGMGKTNLLEAIYQFSVLRSFRTSKRSELILAEAEEARIEGVFEGASGRMTCKMNIRDKSRNLEVDGKVISRFSEHFRILPMVLFHPATMSITQDGPEKRRQFMDRALYQAEATYPLIHREYAKALASRNQVLKKKPLDRRALASFNPVLAKRGFEIFEMRTRFMEKIGTLFEVAFENISGGLMARVSYVPKLSGTVEQFSQSISKKESVDCERGFTSLGPHADDIYLEINGKNVRIFASQGQHRMIALALKIAETSVLQESTGRIPMLLLDDISSELDCEKNQRLFEFLEGVGSQVFITTTHLDHILTKKERTDFLVESGKVKNL